MTPPDAERGPRTPLISVVIPCFNQGRFLADAITSVLAQTYAPVEAIVIDDGSTDESAAVCLRYPSVRHVFQRNAGLPAARNAGLRISGGEYVAFLDADDRLLRDALKIGEAHLRQNPTSAFVFGDHRYIDLEGRVVRSWTRTRMEGDRFAELLRRNCIGMAATVLYRRQVLEAVGGFDERLRACEDYDLYLRIARAYPISDHTEPVAEYRRYGGAMSDDPARMLSAAIDVLRSHRSAVSGNPAHLRAHAAGMQFWRGYYGPLLAEQARRHVGTPGARWRGLRELWLLTRRAPGALGAFVGRRPPLLHEHSTDGAA